MALIDYIDGPNRNIYLSASTVNTTITPMDIYKEMRTLRANDETLRSFTVFMSAFGNVPTGPATATARFVQLNNGTRIIPYDTSHELTIVGTIITDGGQSGIVAFDRTLLSASTVVDINYVPPQVEVITIAGGSGLDSTQDALLTSIAGWSDEIHRIHGLNTSYDLTVSSTTRTAGTGIQQTITNDGSGNITVSRD